jgi:transcriptional regulator GlxA family with amidase domain
VAPGVRLGLLSRPISADNIAAQLGMSRRTLHRRLDAVGLRYQEVLDENRCEFARQLLGNTKLEIREIERIIGYADTSVSRGRSFAERERRRASGERIMKQPKCSVILLTLWHARTIVSRVQQCQSWLREKS